MPFPFLAFCCYFISSFFFTQDFSPENKYIFDPMGRETIESVQSKEGTLFNNQINQGLHSGVYWVHLQALNKEYTLVLGNHRIDELTAFSENNLLEFEKDTRYPTLHLPVQKSVWLRINCKAEVSIPFQFYPTHTFKTRQVTSFLWIGIYFGFALMVFLLNLFFFQSFKDSTFLFYSFFLLAVSLSLFAKDGLWNLLHFQASFIPLFEVLSHMGVIVFGALFASYYLNLRTHFGKSIWLIHSVGILSLCAYLSFQITQQFLWFALGDLFNIITLGLYWLSSIYLFYRSNYYKYFAIAYSFLLFLGLCYFVAPLFNFWSFLVNPTLIKLSGVFEMLVLTHAITYRINQLSSEYRSLEKALTHYLKEVNELTTQLDRLKQGKENAFSYAHLSAREIDIVTLLSQGLINKEIAQRLNISVNTVKFHVKNVYSKLKISSRKEIVAKDKLESTLATEH